MASSLTKLVAPFVGVTLVLFSTACGSLFRTGGKGIECKLEQVKDNQRSGLVAFTYFVPKGWEPKSSFGWNQNNTFTAEMSAMTPDKHYVVDQLEMVNMFYANTNGKNFGGMKIEHATDFLNALVGRLQSQPGITEVKVESSINNPLPLTDSQKMLAQGLRVPNTTREDVHEMGYVKISFKRDGVEEVGELGTTVQLTNMHSDFALGVGQTQTHSISENGTYIVGPTLYVVSPVNANPAKIKEAKIIASSCRCTPKFGEFCAKLALALSEASLKATEARGRQLVRDMETSRQRRMADFREQMARKDAQTHDFCNYILDQQDFKQSNGQVVTMPTAYDHAWSNGKGEYYLSSDPTFDPRGPGSGAWEKMEKTRASQSG